MMMGVCVRADMHAYGVGWGVQKRGVQKKGAGSGSGSEAETGGWSRCADGNTSVKWRIGC